MVTASHPLGSRMTSDDGAAIDAREVASSTRGRLLLDGADDHEAPSAIARLPADRGDGGREWPLGVHRPAPVEQITVATDIDVPGDGVDVSDERDRLGAVAPRGDHVACRVDVNVESGAQESRHEQRRERILLRRSGWVRQHRASATPRRRFACAVATPAPDRQRQPPTATGAPRATSRT